MTERSISEEQMDRWMRDANLPTHHSIADLIADFASGDSSGEIACAHMYAAFLWVPCSVDSRIERRLAAAGLGRQGHDGDRDRRVGGQPRSARWGVSQLSDNPQEG